MMEHQARLTVPSDVRLVADYMRSADKEEVWAASGRNAHEALDDAVGATPEPLTFAPGGVPAAIFGVVPHPDILGLGAPWLLATDAFTKHRRHLVKFGPIFRDLVTRDFTYLMNFVDARNTVHIQWIKRLGFNIVEEVPSFGHAGLPFLKFERRNHV